MKKKAVKRQKSVEKSVDAAPVQEANDGQIHTGVDALLELVKKKKKISLREAAKLVKYSPEVVEDWASILEEEGIISIEYTFTNTFLISADAVTKQQAAKDKSLRGTLLTNALGKEKEDEAKAKRKKDMLKDVVVNEDVEVEEKKIGKKEFTINVKQKVEPEEEKLQPIKLNFGKSAEDEQKADSEKTKEENKSFFSKLFGGNKQEEQQNSQLDSLALELKKELEKVKQEEAQIKKDDQELKKQVEALKKQTVQAVSEEEKVKKELELLKNKEKEDVQNLRVAKGISTGVSKVPIFNLFKQVASSNSGRKLRFLKSQLEKVDKGLLQKIDEVKGVDTKQMKNLDSSVHAELKKINDYLVSLRELQKHQQNQLRRLQKKDQQLSAVDSGFFKDVDALKKKKVSHTKFALFHFKNTADKKVKEKISELNSRLESLSAAKKMLEKKYETDVNNLKKQLVGVKTHGVLLEEKYAKVARGKTLYQQLKHDFAKRRNEKLKQKMLEQRKLECEKQKAELEKKKLLNQKVLQEKVRMKSELPEHNVVVKSPVLLPRLNKMLRQKKQVIAYPKGGEFSPIDLNKIFQKHDKTKKNILKELAYDPTVKNREFVNVLRSLFSKSKKAPATNFKTYDDMEGDTDRALWQKHLVAEGLSRTKIKALLNRRKKLKIKLKQLQYSSGDVRKEKQMVEVELNQINGMIKR